MTFTPKAIKAAGEAFMGTNDLLGKQMEAALSETPVAYLRRLIDGLIDAGRERDEAYERAAKVAEQPGLWPKMYRALDRVKIAAAIRRLAAGTEKEGK